MASGLVIIPTYNERDNVAALSQQVLKACPEVEVLFVDDNSPDGTGVLLDELVAAEPRIHVLHRSAKQGLGRAYVAGFDWALERDFTFIFEMDADFSHDPREIPNLLAQAQQADVVLGSRYVDGIRVINWPLHRLILSRTAGYYVKWVTGMPFSDPTGGYRCYRRTVLEALRGERIKAQGYAFQIEMAHTAWISGFQVVEWPITFEDRHSGTSKMGVGIVREALWRVWKCWFRAGLRRRPRAIHAASIRQTGEPATITETAS